MVDFKALMNGVKWSLIGTLILSGWIMAAWIKADLKPDRIEPLSTLRRVEIVAQKPDKGQEWATYDCAKIRYVSEKNSPKSGSGLPVGSTGSALQGSSGQSSTESGGESRSPEGGVLPLGRFLLPSGGRDPVYVTPELDPVSGETKLQVEPAGGFARFGGERYAFMDFSYQKLLQSDFALSDVPALSIGLHQDLGRIGKMELMAEGWLQASVLESQLDRSVELGVGVRLRVALPF